MFYSRGKSMALKRLCKCFILHVHRLKHIHVQSFIRRKKTVTAERQNLFGFLQYNIRL